MTFKRGMTQTLPIAAVLPELVNAIKQHGRAVLVAPPGAGKTTMVPLALLQSGHIAGRIVMLEPRRLAARSAASRMADTLGEKLGETVGYRIRGETRTGPATRIEVVTEGILTRMLQSDPALTGIGAVVFDEFHERSLNADLGLALTWEVRQALRDDLAVLVMSATLDAAPVAALLDGAPVISSLGRAYPVENIWLERPMDARARLEGVVADHCLRALAQNAGDVLVFLPGEREIHSAQAALHPRLPEDCHVLPLYGALNFKAQQQALAPPKPGQRRVVLASAIAETSLTIAGVRVVIDAGLARRAMFDLGNGMSRLVTTRVSKAEAEQRRGRAGRVAKGRCYRLWTKGEEGGLAAFAPAEIEIADLSALALELAVWGSKDGSDLAFLTPPNPGMLAEAQKLLARLGALDSAGKITPHGKAMARLPLHPRLAHMVLRGGQGAAALAALVSHRDPLPRDAGVDVALRMRALRRNDRNDQGDRGDRRAGGAPHHAALAQIRDEEKRLKRLLPTDTGLSTAEMAALAWPDRVGLRRKGDDARYVLSGGSGVVMDNADALAGAGLIVVLDTDGKRRDAKIRSAVEISQAELRGLYAAEINWQNTCAWDGRAGRVLARQQEMFGALVLSDRNWKDAPKDHVAQAMLDGVRALGLLPTPAAARFLTRVELVRASGQADLPDLSEAALIRSLETWLLPHLAGVKTARDWKEFDLLPALRACLSWQQTQALDQLVPAHFTTPLGHKAAVDYSHETPEISVRIQEMFGATQHPMLAGIALRVTLLSPAGRPLQTTTDLPAFWQGSYQDVRKDMRGRYPKHPWPEDPAQAAPTSRAKPRKR